MTINHPHIPYFQTSRYRVETMMELAEVKPGEKAVDLGSGDGRILIALAQQGALATGYETDQDLLELAKKNIKDVNMSEKILLKQRDFWQEDLSSFSLVTCYPMPDIMEDLEKKLFSELKPTSRILLNYYPFQTHKEVKIKDHIYLFVT